MIQWQIQFDSKIPSPNSITHWRQIHNIKKKHQKTIRCLRLRDKPKLQTPALIALTRIAPREYDYDNLVMAFKPIRDILASLFFPEKAPGHADASKDLTWQYLQEKGSLRQYSIKITISKVP
jgi:hypothetical protein